MTRRLPHCETCTCEPGSADQGITIYAPNERAYGRCEVCGEVRWDTERYSVRTRYGAPERTRHCGCCTHRHNLPNGGHERSCMLHPSTCPLLDRALPSAVVYPGPQ